MNKTTGYYLSILSDIICQTVRDKLGRFKPELAFMMTFKTSINYAQEEGYRYVDLLIRAPMNYTQVWSRDRWNVIDLKLLTYDEANDEEALKPGAKYDEGAAPWALHSDHDSCWPEGVNNVLKEYGDRITVLDGFEWYKIIQLSSLNTDFDKLKNVLRPGGFAKPSK